MPCAPRFCHGRRLLSHSGEQGRVLTAAWYERADAAVDVLQRELPKHDTGVARRMAHRPQHLSIPSVTVGAFECRRELAHDDRLVQDLPDALV